MNKAKNIQEKEDNFVYPTVDISNTKKIFSIRLKKMRNENNLSMGKLAKILNLKSSGTICDYESGRSFPSIEILLLLCTLFNTTTDYLLGRVKEPR